jgi:hypothetical protein
MQIRTILFYALLALLFSTPAARARFSPGDVSPLRDTLYILDSTYIEIRLDEQQIYQHFRNDSTYIYTCSTGNPAVPKGIATREGIFTLKWKAVKQQSSRFEVPMYYWMPYDGGIGIHALAGQAYYWDLGSAATSHGCVRVSRESGEEIFENSPVGTVVYVHSGRPARVLAFADSGMAGLRIVTQSDQSMLRRRLAAVMRGRGDDPSLATKLALSRRTPLAGKIEVGSLPAR